MKQNLRFLVALLIAIVYGGAMFGQTFKKVTQESEIVAGGEYLLVCEKSSKVYAGFASGKSTYGDAIDVTITNSTISSMGDAHVVQIGGKTDNWTIYDETDKVYLALTSASKGKVYQVTDESSTGIGWKITTSNIQNVVNSKYYLQYNTSSPRFACYSGTMQDVVLYKKQAADPIATTLSFGADWDNQTITKKVGETFTQTATLSPTVDGADIKYISSAPSVASVDEKSGEVKVLAEGQAKITASFAGKDNYKDATATYTINAVDASKTATTLTFGQEYDNQTLNKVWNEKFQTPAILTNATDGSTISGDVTYDSDNQAVATIDKDGNVTTGREDGTAVITATYSGDDTYAGSTASYTINVKRKDVKLSFNIPSYTFDQEESGSTKTIEDNSVILDPADAGDVVYSIASDVTDLAKVDANGQVLVSTDIIGKAAIIAKFKGNDTYAPAEASYTIEVKKGVADGVFDFTQSEIDYGSGVKPTNDTNSDYIDNSIWKAGTIVTITTSKGNGNGFRWWINGSANELRAYKDSKLTVSVPTGYSITSIVVEGVNTGLNADCGTMSKGTWTGASQSVTFTPTGRKDIKSITVKYVKLESLTTAASGFATYTASYPVNYSELGLKAYAVKLNSEETKVTYTECTGVVQANKAVLVQGEASKEYALTPATDAEATFDTDLKTSDGNVNGNASTIYAFGTLNGKSGFKLVANGVNIPAKKGYLQLSSSSEAKPTFFSFDGGKGTTGIAGVEADGETNWDNAVIYNMAGQRVSKSYKGVVIVNGKKMLRK